MASRSPSPNSSPGATPPSSSANSSVPPPPPLPSTQPPDSLTPPSPSSPPPVSSPPPPPPQPPPPVESPPPPASPQPPSSPPQQPSSPPPQQPPSPPSPPTLPPTSSSPPPLPPPSSPPPSPPSPSPSTAPPPTANSLPPPTLSSPPPSEASPPKESSAPPVAPPSPPPAISATPPPPASVSSSPPPARAPSLPTSVPPPPPIVHPPRSSHPPLPLPPLPSSSELSPPPVTSPPPSAQSPPPVPISSLPPSISPSSALHNSSVNGSTSSSPLPSLATGNTTARSTKSSPDITHVASRNSGGIKEGGVVVIGGVVGFVTLTLVVLAVWFTNRRRKKGHSPSLNYAVPSAYASSQNSDSSFLGHKHSALSAGSASANNYMYSADGGIGTSRSWFTFEELSGATNGFSKDNMLGEGGFGCVYKGVLEDGREVAVKQLKAGSGQGEREFRAEVEIISRIHHRHLVSLVGYCISEHQRLLVYDYLPNDTLDYHLHAVGKPVMDWATRVRVAAGSARGLAYLHEDCQPRIIHRDIKSSNILLDKNFEARVADFGLAKLAQDLELHTHVSTRVMGTFGYLAPEYASTGKLTVKSDVFSFGVVLLELITGHKPVDISLPLGDESLVEWARPLLAKVLETEDFGDLIDPRLENNFVESEMFRMIEAAAACVRHLASKRPKMSQIVRALDAMDELADLNNGMKPGQSGVFDSREHSAQMRMFQRMAFGSQEFSSGSFNHSQSSWRN